MTTEIPQYYHLPFNYEKGKKIKRDNLSLKNKLFKRDISISK